jgi:hypothetical protein
MSRWTVEHCRGAGQRVVLRVNTAQSLLALRGQRLSDGDDRTARASIQRHGTHKFKRHILGDLNPT